MQKVGATSRRARVGNDVVTVAAMHLVGFIAAVQAIVSCVAPQRVDTIAALKRVVASCAAQHDVLAAGKLQVSTVGLAVTVHVSAWRAANHFWMQDLQQRIVGGGVCANLHALVYFKNMVGCLKDQAGYMG